MERQSSHAIRMDSEHAECISPTFAGIGTPMPAKVGESSPFAPLDQPRFRRAITEFQLPLSGIIQGLQRLRARSPESIQNGVPLVSMYIVPISGDGEWFRPPSVPFVRRCSRRAL